MGFIVHRLINRKNERLIYPAIPNNWNFARGKPSKAQPILFEGIYPRKQLYVSPYLLTGIGQINRQENNILTEKSEFKKEIGLDMKYGVNDFLTLDVTVNTDFSQVEADNEQINLSRFSLFFPEKRQFFQERSGIFNFNTGGNTRLFHSRKIGLTRDGRPIRIYGGVRLTGRKNGWDLGVLNMQTASSGPLPSENFVVLRIRRQLINQNSFAGGMFTSRIGANGNHNLTYGLDMLVRTFGSDYASLKWAQTFESTESGNTTNGGLTNSLIYTKWERRTLDGFGYNTEFTLAGRDYNPGIGFFVGNDFGSLKQEIWYGWKPKHHSLVFRHTPYVFGGYAFKNQNNSPDGNVVGFGWEIGLLSRSTINLEFSKRYVDLPTPLILSSDTQIPIGKYSFELISLNYEMSPSKSLRANFTTEGGSFYDGNRLTVVFNPVWNISRHLEIGSTLTLNRLRFSDRSQKFDATIIGFNIRTALNVHFSVTGLVQYNSAENRMGSNVQMRYNFKEGNDLYLVYDELSSTKDQIADSINPVAETRTVLLKYIHTFRKKS